MEKYRRLLYHHFTKKIEVLNTGPKYWFQYLIPALKNWLGADHEKRQDLVLNSAFPFSIPFFRLCYLNDVHLPFFANVLLLVSSGNHRAGFPTCY